MVTLGSSSKPKQSFKAQPSKREEKNVDRYERRNKSEKKERFFNPITSENEE